MGLTALPQVYSQQTRKELAPKIQGREASGMGLRHATLQDEAGMVANFGYTAPNAKTITCP
jgi:hypothetical protein